MILSPESSSGLFQLSKWSTILRNVSIEFQTSKFFTYTISAQYMNNDRESFAWPSARERWPVIIVRDS